MSRRDLTAVHQLLFCEDLDGRRTRNQADRDADEEGAFRRRVVVSRHREKLVRLVEVRGEEPAFPAILREPDQEAAERRDAHFEPEGGALPVLLEEGASEAVVHLYPHRGATLADGGAEGGGFLEAAGGVAVAECALLCIIILPVADQRVFRDFATRLVVPAVARDDVRDNIALVAVLGDTEAVLLEVGADALLRSLVDHLPVSEQYKVVDHIEDFGARLVNDDDDGDAKLRERLERAHDGASGRRVEAGGGLVEEDSHRRSCQFHADANSLPLAA